MWLDKASLNIRTHGQHHALKTQRIGSKRPAARKYINTINAANVGSLVDPTLAAFIVCGPLQFLV